ncbi:hypothetical protein CNMCM5623_002360 [Aspergillus felis]|uniref:Zn(2)-C6 fungal-type domain-containing protein n=1 Tax=Aspergillus felis TaxID=1287682 RepID=A0A8H6Q9N7_9EURO|nr:hypothetical protein CNMCM5623_002360 [Aspergillus felis]
MSPRSSAAPPDLDQLDSSKDKIPACQSCRRKKAKCDREQPCSQCVRFNVICLYDNGRLKPGLRAGAVEQLQRRVEALENMFIGQGILWQKIWDTVSSTDDVQQNGRELERNSLDRVRDRVKDTLLQLAEDNEGSLRSVVDEIHEDSIEQDVPPAKRRKLESQSSATERPTPPGHSSSAHLGAHGLPSREVINDLVEFYFANVHHWIPILHVRKFREQVQTTEGWDKAIHILHAIVATCIRFTHHPDAGTNEVRREMAVASRQKVILNSMESFSVENLQALVIIAFDTIGSGRGPSAWSIVGSMTRTVEQLQLSVEESQGDRGSEEGEYLIQRMVFLKPSNFWWQAEERRRVFWTVFLMDRFCSVSTGWNLSLTSADVKRRLPCEGALWEKEYEVRAPFFGISDKSTFSNSSPNLVDNEPAKGNPEQDAIGGFAYCIEATESLTLVINFFLQHALDLQNAQKAQLWLMKFKELDLRLVQWKLFLPPKWRTASVLNEDGVMDPNLTLAHMTHNTAVILLHQSIAYPPSHWKQCPVRLPSVASAETCIEAAAEIATIGHQFLHHSPILTNPQFSFCLFIAGRMLLTHSTYTKTAIPNQLDSIVASLWEISQRWAGPNTPGLENLASVFAKRLLNARKHASGRASLDIRRTVYSDSTERVDPFPEQDSAGNEGPVNSQSRTNLPRGSFDGSGHSASPNLPTYTGDWSNRDPMQNGPSPNGSLYNALSLAFPPLPLSLQPQYAPLSEAQMLDPALLSKDHIPSLYPAPPVETLHAQPLWDPVAQSYNDCNNNPSPDYADRYVDLPFSPGHRISRYGNPSMNNENIPSNGEVPGNMR